MLIIQILYFLIILSFLIIIHELGHYISAKLFKVKVEEFGLGYPPLALKLFTYAGTVFSLNWIPFGGFVRMDGEEGGSEVASSSNSKHVKESTKSTTKEGPFYEKSRLARLSIVLAGAAINFLFGVFAFSLFFSVKGIPVLLSNARISEVAPGSPAALAGITPQTEILELKIADKTYAIHDTEGVVSLVSQHLGEDITVVTTGPCQQVKCDPEKHSFDMHIRQKSETPEGQGALGIRFDQVIEQKFYPWYEMPIRGAIFGIQQALTLAVLIVQSLGQIIMNLFHGQVPREVAGPVGIFSEARKAGLFSHGFLEMLHFAGLLSVNLAIMNVLPIPALDGGRAVFMLAEIIVGKKRVQKYEGYLNYGAFAILLALTFLITIKDIRQLFIH
jgi:regulator of sigma E protease